MTDISITISVIIPTYNRSDTISQSIRSAMEQSYKPNEIIVVDDCSDDNTKEVLKSINNIIVLNTKENSGAQAARNIGIKAAKSDWIAFLDSDDEWLPDKLEKQIEVLKSLNFNPLSVIHGDCIIKNVDTDDEKIWNLHEIDGKNVQNSLLSKSGTFFPSILTSKQALKEINYLDEKVISFQEWDTAIRLSKFCQFKHIHSPIFRYNIQNNSISINSKNSINGYYYIIQKHKNETIKQCGVQVYNKHLLKCASMAMNSKYFKWGRKFLSEVPISINKIIMLILNYLNIKPNYVYQPLNFLTWKK